MTEEKENVELVETSSSTLADVSDGAEEEVPADDDAEEPEPEDE